MTMPTALESGRHAAQKPVAEVAQGIGIPSWLVEQHSDMRTTPGLAGNPAAVSIGLDDDGNIGLY